MLDTFGDFSTNHSFRTPDQLQYGNGVASKLVSFAQESNVNEAIVVTDEALVTAGVTKSTVAALSEADVSIEIYDNIVTEPKLPMIETLSRRVQKEDYDLVVGIGGGSCLDTAKVASVAADCSASVADIIGVDQVPCEGLPLALLPTTAGTGSEVTNGAVLSDPDDGGVKKVVVSDSLLADIALVDPELTETLPPQIAASTGADALTHAIEAFVTNSRSPLTDVLCQDAMKTIGDALPKAVNEETSEAKYRMSIAATVAGLGFSNAGLGAVHALTYPIGIEYDVGHGLSNATMLPYVMEYNVPAEPERFAEIARLLGRTQDEDQSTRDFAYESVTAVTDLLASIDLPSSLQDVGDIQSTEFERFADIAFKYSKHNIDQNPRPLDREDAVVIFENAS